MTNIIYDVSFPKLGLNFKINPIAFDFGNINIRWYGVIIAIGFLTGFLYVNSRSKKFGVTNSNLLDFIIWPTFLGIIFARIYYVIFYPGDFYIKNPEKIFMINEGGIAIYGAIFGGIIGILLVSKIKKENTLKILDLLSFGVIIGQCKGRWGNFVNQEAFGSKTDFILGMASQSTNFVAVHPCFLYESFGCFLIFLAMHFYSLNKKVREKSGNIFALYLLLYSVLRFFVESLRTDSLMLPFTFIKISQLISVLGILIAIGIFYKNKKRLSQN